MAVDLGARGLRVDADLWIAYEESDRHETSGVSRTALIVPEQNVPNADLLSVLRVGILDDARTAALQSRALEIRDIGFVDSLDISKGDGIHELIDFSAMLDTTWAYQYLHYQHAIQITGKDEFGNDTYGLAVGFGLEPSPLTLGNYTLLYKGPSGYDAYLAAFQQHYRPNRGFYRHSLSIASDQRLLQSRASRGHLFNVAVPRQANDADYIATAWVLPDGVAPEEWPAATVAGETLSPSIFGDQLEEDTAYIVRTSRRNQYSINTAPPGEFNEIVTRTAFEDDEQVAEVETNEASGYYITITDKPGTVSGLGTYKDPVTGTLAPNGYFAFSIPRDCVLICDIEGGVFVRLPPSPIFSSAPGVRTTAFQFVSAGDGDVLTLSDSVIHEMYVVPRFRGTLFPATNTFVETQTQTRKISSVTTGTAQPEEVSYYIKDLKPVASVSSLIADPGSPQQSEAWQSTVEASGATFLSYDLGTMHERDAETFRPRMPQTFNADAAASPASWFNLETSIYPTERKRFTQCAAPIESQPRGSLVIGGPSINSISATLESSYRAIPDSLGFSTGYKRSQLLDPFFNITNTFVSSLDGDPTTQNVWALLAQGQKIDTDVSETGNRIPDLIWSFNDESDSYLEIKSFQANIVARRKAFVYKSQKTATLGELQLTMVARVTGILKDLNTDEFRANRFAVITNFLQLTAEEEELFVAGENIRLACLQTISMDLSDFEAIQKPSRNHCNIWNLRANLA
jgi:hypothetical protein